jgi:hypothetical protein
VAERLNWLSVYGITFAGGLGAFRHRFTGQNVNGRITFERCVFDNYTQCAIGNNASDAPYLRVRDCMFMGRAGAASIGIAWGGYADGSIIERCSFLRNRYHIKLGPYIGGNAHIMRNDFFRWDTQTLKAADIWLVPNSEPNRWGTNSGDGTIIGANKFGNENMQAGDARILVAVEGRGGDRLERHHATAWVPAGPNGAFVSGISIRDCLVAATDGLAAPFIRSHIAELRRLSYFNNRHIGGRHSYLCEFIGARQNSYAGMSWAVEVSAADALLEGSPWLNGMSNALIGPTQDSSGVLAAEEEAMLAPTGGDDTSFALLAQGDDPASFTAVGAAALSVVADRRGAARALEATAPAALAGMMLPMTGAQPGRAGWASLDLKQGAAGSARAVECVIFHPGEQIYARRLRYPLPASWRRVRFPFTLPPARDMSGWQLIVRAEDPGRFAVARAFVHLGREPARDGNLATMGNGKWDGAHIVMGATHIWEEGGTLYIRTGGPPRHATDGRALGQAG